VSVQDPPLDQVIARVFESSKPPELMKQPGDGEFAVRMK
jgi:hypothetical protein